MSTLYFQLFISRNYLIETYGFPWFFEPTYTWRIYKGLSVNLSSELGIVRDQISLPKGDVSLEDILLQQRQLATSFGVIMSVGISYSFGSIYNSIVNTRL